MSYKLKFIYADDAVQNILRKLKKQSEQGRTRKVISSFGSFFTAIAEVLFLKGRVSPRFMFPNKWGFS